MKRIVCLICGCCLFASALAQSSILQIATDKTTSLIFPFSIRHVDRGTKDVLVQQVKEADHILLVKSGKPHLPETNLSVITSDGSVYSFVVCYNPQPDTVVYHLPAKLAVNIATYSSGIADNPRRLRGVKDRSWEIEAMVTGIYVKGKVIYYHLTLHNKSSIDYDIELLKFYIRDKTKGKRTAIQENELLPLHISGNSRQVKAHERSTIVVALDKFTIPDAKFLAIQFIERNGGRHLLLRVYNRKLIKAITLPDLQ